MYQLSNTAFLPRRVEEVLSDGTHRPVS